MSKRASSMTTDAPALKQAKHWSQGLVESMKDPKCVIKKTDRVVIIRDKYPKAKIHYLVLPQDNISNIFKLNKTHISLLEEFGKLFKEIESENKDTILRAGFHAIPSMQRLHMHLISRDMVSPCLKTKVHWNSFTTNFFLPYEEIMTDLVTSGSIKKISAETHKSLMATPLGCNQCNFKPKNMPQLKEHLLSHTVKN